MSRFRRLFQLRRRDKEGIRDDVNAELQHHLELSVEHLVARGMSREDALAEARRRLGADQPVHAAAHARDRRIRLRDHLDIARTELRYIVRGFARQPALTALVVGTLALGIGANATVFPMVDRLLFRMPPGLEKPHELYRLYKSETEDSAPARIRFEISYPEFEAVRDVLAGRAELGLHRVGTTSIGDDSTAAQRVGVADITSSTLQLLGVRLAKGRYFTPDEDTPPEPRRVVIISYDLWQDRFGGDGTIIGRQLRVGVEEFEIVGVTQRGFSGIDIEPTHVWLPLTVNASHSNPRWWQSTGLTMGYGMIARAGGLVEILERDAAGGLLALRAAAGQDSRSARVLFGSIIEGRGPAAPAQAQLIASRLGGVSIVLLLIALANVTNLLLTRTARREREIIVRLALGVSRTRLFATFFAEACCVAVMAAAVATAFSAALSRVVRSLLLPGSGWTPSVVEPRAIAFTALLGFGCALFAGTVSAMRALRADAGQSLRAGHDRAHARTAWVRSTLLGAQSAMSAMLLVGAALFVVSLNRLQNVDIGYDLDDVAFIRGGGSTAGAGQVMRDLEREIAQRADVAATALASMPPLQGGQKQPMYLGDRRVDSDILPNVAGVSPGFFGTMGLSIVRGRALGADDRRGAVHAVVVSQETARVFWPGQEPLGQCIRVGELASPCYTVVGVAENANLNNIIQSAPRPQLWIPLDQGQRGFDTPGALLIRSRGDGVAAATLAAEEYARRSGRSRPSVQTYAAWTERQLRAWKLGAKLFGAVSLTALILAVVGLYGVLTASVAQRSAEIGIRMALGATSRSVVMLIVRQGVRVVAIGICAGLAGAVASSRLIASLLYGTSATNPGVYGAVALVLLAAAAVAAFVPARRAGKLDPVRALRTD